jgi:hypothetical protein
MEDIRKQFVVRVCVLANNFMKRSPEDILPPTNEAIEPIIRLLVTEQFTTV